MLKLWNVYINQKYFCLYIENKNLLFVRIYLKNYDYWKRRILSSNKIYGFQYGYLDNYKDKRFLLLL